MANHSILTTAVEDYIASMTKRELDELIATARDPEETSTEAETSDQIAGRMFGGAK